MGNNIDPNDSKKRAVSSYHMKRLVLIFFGVFFCYVLLIIQFYTIQIIEAKKWSDKAERQHYFTVTEPFRRGTFYSTTVAERGHPSKSQPLAVDVQKYHLNADPLSIPEEKHSYIASSLAELLGVEEKVKDFFLNNLKRKSRSRRLRKWLYAEERDLILKWWEPFARENKIASNALFFLPDYQRSYPFGKFLGQVLHTIQDNKDEVTKQGVPTGGLEYYFNDLLKGKQGKRKLMRSPRHSFETGVIIESPVNGADIYLTIDPCLQAICEEEIENGAIKSGAKSGWAVMMNPYTGEILALAQYPFFFPPDYRRFFNDKNLISDTCVKAITDANEPASVTKALTVAIALKANEELKRRGEAPIFDPEEKIATSDGRFPGRTRPIKDTRVHRYLNMDMAIQKSSNIYVGRLVERIINRLGNEWYRNALIETFGLGKKTGVELPSESPGVLPKPGRKHPNGKPEWSVPTPFSMAMGHNLQTNALQIVRAFSVFANGGYLVQPTIVRKIIKKDNDGKEKILVDHTTSEWRGKSPRVMSQEIVDRVIRSLKFVTKPGGGGWRADVHGYTEVGKTGTAKKIVDGKYSSKSYSASFVGYTPVNKPAFVLMVVYDEPDISYKAGVGYGYYGSLAAAPVFKTIAQRSLEYLGTPPDDQSGFPNNDPRYDSNKADWIREALLLKEKYEKWNN